MGLRWGCGPWLPEEVLAASGETSESMGSLANWRDQGDAAILPRSASSGALSGRRRVSSYASEAPVPPSLCRGWTAVPDADTIPPVSAVARVAQTRSRDSEK